MKEIDEINSAQDEVFKSHLQNEKWKKLINYIQNDKKTILKNEQLIKDSVYIQENDDTLFYFEDETNILRFTPKLDFILQILQIIEFNKENFMDRLFYQILQRIEEFKKPQIIQFIESFPESRFFSILEQYLSNYDFLYSLVDVYPKKMVEYLPQLKAQKEWRIILRLYDFDNSLTDRFPEIFLEVLEEKCINYSQIQNFIKNFDHDLKERVKVILETKKDDFLTNLSPFSKLSLLNLEKKTYGWFDNVFFVMTDDEIKDIVWNALQIEHYYKYSNNIIYAYIVHDILLSIVWNGKGHLLIPFFDKILEYNHKQPVSDFLKNNPKEIENVEDIPALILKLDYFSEIFLSQTFLNLFDYDINVFSAFLKAKVRYWKILKFFKRNFRENSDEYDKEILKLYKNFDFNLKTDYEICLSFFLYSNDYYENKQYFPSIPRELFEKKVEKYLDSLSTQRKPFLNLLQSWLICDKYNDFSITIQNKIIESFSYQLFTFLLMLVQSTKISNPIIVKILNLVKFKDYKNYGANNQIFLILKFILMNYSLSEEQIDIINELLKQSPDQPLKAQIYSYLGEFKSAVEIWEKILPTIYIRKWFITQKASYLGDLMNLEPIFSYTKKQDYISTLKFLDTEFHLLDITSQESTNFGFKFRFLQIKAQLNHILNKISSGRKIHDNSYIEEILKSINQLKNKNIPDSEKNYLKFLYKFVDLLKIIQNMDSNEILPFVKENIQTMQIPNKNDFRYNQFLDWINDLNNIPEFSSLKFSNPVTFCPVNSIIKDIIFYHIKVINSTGTQEKEILWKFSDKKSQFLMNISNSFKLIQVSVITEKRTLEKPIIIYPKNSLIEIRQLPNSINKIEPKENSKTQFDYKFYIKGDNFQDLLPIVLNFKESNLCGLTIKCNILLKHETSEINPESFLISSLEATFQRLLNKKKDLRKTEKPISSMLDLGIRGLLEHIGIQVKLEDPGGESSTGKETGERDFIFTWKNKEFAILEALRLVTKKKNKVILDHLKKIFQYDSIGHKTLIIACYVNENLNLEEEWNNYCYLVNNFTWKYPQEGYLQDISEDLPHEIKKGLTFHKRNTQDEPNVTIYHYLIHGFEFVKS
jgi:hypothetical protein